MKKFIIINLNQAESRESKMVRWRERSRWGFFSFLIILFLGLNACVFLVSNGYNNLIKQKKSQIKNLEEELASLQSKGKNLSKADIFSLTNLEQNRVLWARNLQLLGQLTPDDMAITKLEYKNNKLSIECVSVLYEDQKPFDVVNKFVGRLKNNREFSDNFDRIKFVKSVKQTVRGQVVLIFNLEATVIPGASSVTHS